MGVVYKRQLYEDDEDGYGDDDDSIDSCERPEGHVAQGGDWGGAVTTYIGMQNLGNARAIHTNMPVAGPTPESLENPTEQEVGALEALGHYDKWDSGYSKQQSTRPQTLGYGLVDSAAGQAAWIAEKMWAWTDNDGHPEDALTKDQMHDNISIYWFTGSGASSARSCSPSS